MIGTLRGALDRTLLLMRDEIDDTVGDDLLLTTLTDTEIALVADETNLASHSSQTAYITAALLMARSGHRVHIVAPDVSLIGPQPPLSSGSLVSSLCAVGCDLLPNVEFSVGRPNRMVDLAVTFGDSLSTIRAANAVSIGTGVWSVQLRSSRPAHSTKTNWPFGGIAGGALASVEAFKVALWKLRRYAKNLSLFHELFAPANRIDFELAPAGAPRPQDIGRFDCISAGAIINSVLYALARIPGLTGFTRIVDDDVGEISNLNRNALLVRSKVALPKASMVASLNLGGLLVEPVLERYGAQSVASVGELAPKVLVGVDHIPTRWEVQKANPLWLGVGATSHWAAMASFHVDGLGCAGCLHPTDDQIQATVPTVAFVSLWAGLLLATYFARAAGGESLPADAQQTYLTPLRLEAPWRSPVRKRSDCPVEAHVTG
jgi:hypothetical protein